jgi:hypothetical protein
LLEEKREEKRVDGWLVREKGGLLKRPSSALFSPHYSGPDDPESRALALRRQERLLRR